MKSLRERLNSGEFLLGTHIHTGEPSLTELAGRCGFDYLWIDTEHTAVDYRTLQMHLIAAAAAGCPAIVRVPQNEPYLAKRVLDAGPDGIIFPNINSPEEARKAMDACLYPPDGKRGYGPVRAVGYGLERTEEYLASARGRVCRFVQAEHVEAVRSLEAILEVDGIDGVILGPCDLSGSIGRLGDMDCDEVQELIGRTIEVCRKRGVPVGVSLGACDGETVLAWKKRGVQFASAGSEYGFVAACAGQLTAAVKGRGSERK